MNARGFDGGDASLGGRGLSTPRDSDEAEPGIPPVVEYAGFFVASTAGDGEASTQLAFSRAIQVVNNGALIEKFVINDPDSGFRWTPDPSETAFDGTGTDEIGIGPFRKAGAADPAVGATTITYDGGDENNRLVAQDDGTPVEPFEVEMEI